MKAVADGRRTRSGEETSDAPEEKCGVLRRCELHQSISSTLRPFLDVADGAIDERVSTLEATAEVVGGAYIVALALMP